VHRYHGSLFLLHVEKLNQTLLAASFKVPLASVVRALLFKKFLNVKLPHLYFVVFYDVQGTLNSTCVSTKADFLSCEVSQNRNLTLYPAISSESDKVMVKLVSIACESNPISINEDFCLLLV
jgi:hypothetical protein